MCLAYSIRNCSVHISDIAEYFLSLSSLFDSLDMATMEVHDLQLQSHKYIILLLYARRMLMDYYYAMEKLRAPMSARENCVGDLQYMYIPVIRQSSGPSINTCEKVCTMEIVW